MSYATFDPLTEQLVQHFAAGYGGQYLWVVPDLDLIVVTTANYQLPPSLVQDYNFLITDFVVASAL